jgi:hypothetical protein
VRRFQFNLITLVFWTTVCAAGAGIVKMFLDRGHRGVDYLLAYAAVGSWLAVTWIAILLRVYAPRRWEKARARRRELEEFVRSRRAARRTGPKTESANWPPPAN